MNMKDLIAAFRNPPREFRPVSFWFLNHFLEDDELRRQIAEQDEKGFGGVMCHARDGLRTAYLEQEWEDAMRVILDECRQRGMHVWLYDENHYPSGIAGGKIPRRFPDRTMLSLVPVVEQAVGAGDRFRGSFVEGSRRPSIAVDGSREPPTPRYLLATGTRTGETVDLLPLVKDGRLDWTNDLGEPAVVLALVERGYETNPVNHPDFSCLEDGMGEHVRQIGSSFDVMKHQNFNAVDIITPKLWGIEGGEPITACMRNTASAALFYDSPKVMCEVFGCCGGWGLDLREMRRIGGHLAALGIDSFVPHGLYYSIAATRKYECIPDHLHNPMWAYYREWSDSAGRLAMLTAGTGSRADVAVLYPVTTLQATVALGAAETAFAYGPPATGLDDVAGASSSGDARPGAGPGRSGHLPASADDDANLHAALDARPGADRGADAERVRDLYDGLLDALSQQFSGYEILPEDVLQSAATDAEPGKLCIPVRAGRELCRFAVTVLPGVAVLETATLAKLETFAGQGGPVLCLGAVPREVYDPVSGTLTPLAAPFLDGQAIVIGIERSPSDAVAEACAWLREHVVRPLVAEGAEPGALVSRTWIKDDCRYYLLHNSTDQTVADVSLTLRDDDEPLRLDLDRPALERIAWQRRADAWQVKLELAPAQSMLFVCGVQAADAVPALDPVVPPANGIPVTGPWTVSTDRPNGLMLRHGVMDQRRSRLCHTFAFSVNVIPPDCRLLLDLEMTLPELHAGRYCNRLEVTLNGMAVRDFEPGIYLDRHIREADVTAMLRQGANELVIQVAASLREAGQRLWPPMLAGDFGVRRDDTGGTLIALPRKIALGDWTAQGYPDFAGEGRYRATLRVPPGERAWLDLGELANACEVRIDGQGLGRRIAPPWRFAVPASEKPERELEVRVINTPWNLFEIESRPVGLFGPVCLVWCNDREGQGKTVAMKGDMA